MRTMLDSQFHLDRECKFVLKLFSFALNSVGVESYTGGKLYNMWFTFAPYRYKRTLPDPNVHFQVHKAQLCFALLSFVREHSTVNLNPLVLHTHTLNYILSLKVNEIVKFSLEAWSCSPHRI